MNAKYFIEKFNLEKHPEGGYYKRTYRSKIRINKQNLPYHNDDRHCQTAIYYLLEAGNVSKFHRLKSDEIWFFHYGNSLVIYTLSKQGEIIKQKLGSDINKGENFQILIPAHTWFAAEAFGKSSFSFVSCTVAPGFDFEDFEIAEKSKICNKFPELLKFDEKFFK